MIYILNIIILFLVYTFYVFYREFLNYKYRQSLFVIREKLFLLASEQKIDYNNKDYRYIELKLNTIIKNSEKYTLFEIMLSDYFILKKIDISKLNKKYEIKSKKIKKIDEILEEEAMKETAKYMIFGSFTGIVYIIFLILKMLFSNKEKNLKNNFDEKINSRTHDTLKFLGTI